MALDPAQPGSRRYMSLIHILSPGAQYLPARRCVHTFFTRQSQTNQPFWRNLTYVFDFLHKEGLEVSGSILVEPLLLLKRSTERLLYAQAFFPID